MAAKDIEFASEARGKMMHGIDLIADAVKATLGPKGRNVILDSAFGPPRVSKDGVSVAKEIELSDRFENMGAQMLREVASRTSDLVGDGTTTASVLAQAMMREGFKAEAAGMNPMDLKRGIDAAVAVVVSELRLRARQVTNSEEVAQIGAISANGDHEIGDMIAAAMERVGRHGVITVEEAKSLKTEIEVVEGLRFDRGFLSPYFVTDAEKLICELEEPYIFVCDRKINNLQSLLPMLEAAVQSGSPIVFIAEDIEGDALSVLVVNRLRGGLKCVAVKAPGFGDQKKAMMQDIGAVTGADVISEELGVKFEDVKLEMLGRAAKVIVTKDDTTIVEGRGEEAKIQQRCRIIENEIESTVSNYDREKLKERLAKLAGGVAILRVGGSTETEMKELRDRIDDAMHATRAALEEGILPGGGAALLHAGSVLMDLKPENADQRVGVEIVRRSLEAPLRQIVRNAGLDGSVIANRLSELNNPTTGYDAQKNVYVNMFEAGIIDPVKVVRIALQDAASIAGLLITTEVMVADMPEPSGLRSTPMPAMGNQMGF